MLTKLHVHLVALLLRTTKIFHVKNCDYHCSPLREIVCIGLFYAYVSSLIIK